jgi:transposase
MDTKESVRRKLWPEAVKREIVAASVVPGASVSMIARQYDVNTNLVFTWRRRFAAERASAATPQLVPVVVTPDHPVPAPAARSNDLIEIELPHGTRVRVGSGVKAAALRLVLDLLERR